MNPYPKKILSTADMIQKYTDAELQLPDESTLSLEETLNQVGFYRLRGYSFQFFNAVTKKYVPGTSFEQILSIYNFDEKLRGIIFNMTCEIEIALRVRYCNAMLQTGDVFSYLDPMYSKDKEMFWGNASKIASEINRSADVFIKHNHKNHNGQIPLWAAVEVMSFGNLSKHIKNMKDGTDSPYRSLAKYYEYKTPKGNTVVPKNDFLSSWIYSTVTLRNICAHNARIYNRSLPVKPTILDQDRQQQAPRYYGLYQVLLAMKYLRPSDHAWMSFYQSLKNLTIQYAHAIDLKRLNFPEDWEAHLQI